MADDILASVDLQEKVRQVLWPMAWWILVCAGGFEIFWAVGLKMCEGFTKLGWSIATIVALILSIVLLGIASKSLPIGTAYAVWTGIGAVGTAICGMIFLGDPVNAGRLVCLSLILSGIVGLKFLA